MNESEAKFQSISENLIRENFTTMETANAYYEVIKSKIDVNLKKEYQDSKQWGLPWFKKKLQEEYAQICVKSNKNPIIIELAEEFGVSTSTIVNILTLLNLPEPI